MFLLSIDQTKVERFRVENGREGRVQLLNLEPGTGNVFSFRTLNPEPGTGNRLLF
jgi:hypothetical protein